MRVAVLPFNAAEGTKPALGRQLAAFVAEQLRVHAEADINAVSYLAQVQGPDGVVRMEYAEPSEELLPYDRLADLFQQAEVDLVMDGNIKQAGDHFTVTVRFSGKESPTPLRLETLEFDKADLFANIHRILKMLADQAEIGLPEFLGGESLEVGTQNPDAFLLFLEGVDAINYMQQSNGQVSLEYSPDSAIDALLETLDLDPEFEAAYHVLVQICRACAGYRVGTFEKVDGTLAKLIEKFPSRFPAYFGRGEIYQAVNNLDKAQEFYEKAIQREQQDPGLYSRLGLVQLQMGMPVNAERNFKRALALEGPDKPSADYLAVVLNQTGRGHEIPGVWRSIIEENPQNSQAHAKYAISLIQAGKEAEGQKAFESAIEVVEDNAIIKRYYAPLLVQQGDLDRAMDFYEDALDVAPNDVPTLVEYSQTLEAAGREFEVPNVLKQILASEPDQDTRTQAMARLIEIEQPKRVENVDNAQKKMEQGDFHGAIRDLKPLRNWLADYWKLWALLATAYNRTEQYAEAEEAARRVLEMAPGSDVVYGEMVKALVEQNRAEEAFQLMQQLAQINPSSLGMAVNLGLAAKHAGHRDEARQIARQIREALAQDPNREQLEPVLAEMES